MRSKIRPVFLGALVLLAAWALGPWLLRAEVAGIRTYQASASRMVGSVITCRYEPTCSHYGLSALKSNGFWRGNTRLAIRLLLCSPLGWFLEQVGVETYPLRANS